MNNRDYKNFNTGSIFHIYNRGNNKEPIFYDESDYRAFLLRLGLVLGIEEELLKHHPLTSVPYSRIRLTAEKNLFRVHSFCLMPNHFHLLLEQCSDIPISNLMLKVCTSFAKYINKKYQRVGHIFQDQFKSVLIESDSQLMWTSSYIHMNPVKATLCKTPRDYPWSSYHEFLDKKEPLLVHTKFILDIFGNVENFEQQTTLLSSEKE